MLLVTGATGTNGGALARELARQGYAVRALVRDLDKAAQLVPAGIELVRGDFSDTSSLDAALEGTQSVFFVAGLDEHYAELFEGFLAAVQRGGKQRVVKLSALTASPDAASVIIRQHAAADAQLMASGLPYTILRPNSFHQNALGMAATVRTEGRIYAAVGQARQSFIDVRDITAVAVQAMTADGHTGQVYELTGAESLSHHDLAAQLSQVAGKQVQYVAITSAAVRAALINHGLTLWQAEALAEIQAYFATEVAAYTVDTVQRLLGRPPLSFAQFAQEHAEAFR